MADQDLSSGGGTSAVRVRNAGGATPERATERQPNQSDAVAQAKAPLNASAQQPDVSYVNGKQSTAGKYANRQQGQGRKRGGSNNTYRTNGASPSMGRRSSRGAGIKRNNLLRDLVEVDDSLPLIKHDELRRMDIQELSKYARDKDIILERHRLRKSELLQTVLQHLAGAGHPIEVEGILEGQKDGSGMLRDMTRSFLPGPDDVVVPSNLTNANGWSTGDLIRGQAQLARMGNGALVLVSGEEINSGEARGDTQRTEFENLTPVFPDQHLSLEIASGSNHDVAGRIIDLVAPIGKGQRGLIVSPPKAGKTVLLQGLAQSIRQNNPECELIILLIDERPEEVTDMQRSVNATIVASNFDEPASRHVQTANLVLGYARGLVEANKDVVVLLDSITRLARAYNTVQPASGRILTGGLDSNSMDRPKRFFGAARNIEGGGSLTILATALIETGSKMDDIIYEEFKGTGNMEVHLERRISEKRVFPAINVRRSGTRREELLLEDERLQKMWLLRRVLQKMDDVEATELVLERIKASKNNAEFFESMQGN